MTESEALARAFYAIPTECAHNIWVTMEQSSRVWTFLDTFSGVLYPTLYKEIMGNCVLNNIHMYFVGINSKIICCSNGSCKWLTSAIMWFAPIVQQPFCLSYGHVDTRIPRKEFYDSEAQVIVFLSQPCIPRGGPRIDQYLVLEIEANSLEAPDLTCDWVLLHMVWESTGSDHEAQYT